MAIEHLLLYFLACGGVTFPLTLFAVRFIASLSPGGRIARKLDATFEKMLTVAVMVWLVGALGFYAAALYHERQRYCDEQRTNQLTDECRKLYGQED
jgi:mannitol-specific phosphotransferase system IIBC component